MSAPAVQVAQLLTPIGCSRHGLERIVRHVVPGKGRPLHLGKERARRAQLAAMRAQILLKSTDSPSLGRRLSPSILPSSRQKRSHRSFVVVSIAVA